MRRCIAALRRCGRGRLPPRTPGLGHRRQPLHLLPAVRPNARLRQAADRQRRDGPRRALPGWTLPGVFTLGGAQVALKDQGCLDRKPRRLPGLVAPAALAAKQVSRHWGRDRRHRRYDALRRQGSHAAGAAASTADVAARHLVHGRVAARRNRVLHGVVPVAIEGEDRVEALVLRDARGRERRFACDAVALGYGLKPETQLADLARADSPMIPISGASAEDRWPWPGPARPLSRRGWRADRWRRRGRGERCAAAHAILSDLGHLQAVEAVRPARGRSERLRNFQRGLARAFAWPAAQIAALPDLRDAVPLRECDGRRGPRGDEQGTRPDRGQPGQGDDALRDGPLPGPGLRPRLAGDRGGEDGTGRRLRRAAARSGPGQADRDSRQPGTAP